MLFHHPFSPSPLLKMINNHLYDDETMAIEHLLNSVNLSYENRENISVQTEQLIERLRLESHTRSAIESLLSEYNLSTEEGIALMNLAEALLRIPDKATIHKLMEDKLTAKDWQAHFGHSSSSWVNWTTYALALTEKLLLPAQADSLRQKILMIFNKVLQKGGEPVLRQVISRTMRILARQFIIGQNMKEALHRSRTALKKGYCYSYDVLGEAARTQQEADFYFQSYQQAIREISLSGYVMSDILQSPGISIKLSALSPRYEFKQFDRVIVECVPRLFALAQQAKMVGISLTVDAEEIERLNLSLAIVEAVVSDPALKGWEGFGIAVQAYHKSALWVLKWLKDLAAREKHRIMVRLVKGAYWDREIKYTQQLGLRDYPVYTRKAGTDLSYLACASYLLEHNSFLYPQFATHNAYTVMSIIELFNHHKASFEFQRLQGMGRLLYKILHEEKNYPCRIYAPVGPYQDLLPYLMRRLLENGANSSFMSHIYDEKITIEKILEDPISLLEKAATKHHPDIPLPKNIYLPARRNAKGLNLADYEDLEHFQKILEETYDKNFWGCSIINGDTHMQKGSAVFSPTDRRKMIGHVCYAQEIDIEQAIEVAIAIQNDWSATSVEMRANILLKMADLLESKLEEFMAILVREGGKTIPDALTEVREAIDFCRYYSHLAITQLGKETILSGYTGERNILIYEGRGLIVCISPWNFPLSIFLGQIAAALVAGNVVIAKPAMQTPFIATAVVQLFLQAGLPSGVLQLLIGEGKVVGEALVRSLHVAGILLTGSTKTAKRIQQLLTEYHEKMIPFIAETGGQNAMIVDSSALPEQVVDDVMQSAFGSAGQRCSALRVLYLQAEIAPKILSLLKGAMHEWIVGDPSFLATDVGPVIDEAAQQRLLKHIDYLNKNAEFIYSGFLPSECEHGTFVSPHIFRIDSIQQLKEEVFGPILHVIIYESHQLEKVIQEINQTGYGLTFGIHSRIDQTIHQVVSKIQAGNCYINRSMVGAVVGVQPFGGRGFSGTGPKAGGPNYLKTLCHEKVISVNTAAVGGNTELLNLTTENNEDSSETFKSK